MRRQRRKGQSILEYTLLLGAIIAVLIAVLVSDGGVKSKVQTTYEKVGDSLTKTSDDLSLGVFK
jgi:Flp pilus assembly pilin Flp